MAIQNIGENILAISILFFLLALGPVNGTIHESTSASIASSAQFLLRGEVWGKSVNLLIDPDQYKALHEESGRAACLHLAFQFWEKVIKCNPHYVARQVIISEEDTREMAVTRCKCPDAATYFLIQRFPGSKYYYFLLPRLKDRKTPEKDKIFYPKGILYIPDLKNYSQTMLYFTRLADSLLPMDLPEETSNPSEIVRTRWPSRSSKSDSTSHARGSGSSSRARNTQPAVNNLNFNILSLDEEASMAEDQSSNMEYSDSSAFDSASQGRPSDSSSQGGPSGSSLKGEPDGSSPRDEPSGFSPLGVPSGSSSQGGLYGSSSQGGPTQSYSHGRKSGSGLGRGATRRGSRQ